MFFIFTFPYMHSSSLVFLPSKPIVPPPCLHCKPTTQFVTFVSSLLDNSSAIVLPRSSALVSSFFHSLWTNKIATSLAILSKPRKASSLSMLQPSATVVFQACHVDALTQPFYINHVNVKLLVATMIIQNSP